MRVLVISADGFEDMELMYPVYRFREHGWEVTLAAPGTATITGKHGYTVRPDLPFSEVNPDAYSVLVIPGGKAPEEVRLDHDAIDITRYFFEKSRPVAAICHGPQVLVSAGVLKNRKVTCWKGVKDDVVGAGARYTDAEVVVDGNLVTSRMPDDLPAFMRETLVLAAKAIKKMAA